MQIAVCIPTLDRFAYLAQNVPRYLQMPMVDQVVISDETGADIARIRAEFPEWASDPKLVMTVNSGRHGAFHNKQAAVANARPGWIALMDSDNFATAEEYFAPWLDFVSRGGGADPNTIYMPGHSVSPETGRIIDFREFERIDRTNVGTAVAHFWSASSLLNNGNFIVHTETYLKPCIVPQIRAMSQSRDVLVVDAAAKTIGLVAGGASIQIVPSMTYSHAVHAGSLWAQFNRTDLRKQQSRELHMLSRMIEQTFRQRAAGATMTPLPTPNPHSRFLAYMRDKGDV